MNRRPYIYFLGLLTAVLAAAAMISESIYFGDFEYRFRTKKFNSILAEKERIMEQVLDSIKPILAMDYQHGSGSENSIFALAEQNHITILEYLNNRLIYWSDNDFDVPLLINDTIFSRNLVFFQNGWFLPKTIEAANEKIVGLLRIRTEYNFENDIIKSGFEKEFRIPPGVEFSTDRKASRYHITNRNGDFLFSLIFPEIKVKTYFIFLPLMLWSLSFMALIAFILMIGGRLASAGKGLAATLFVLASFVAVYAVILVEGRPLILFQTELFSPYRFSLNGLIPSLGHLVLLSIMASAFSSVFFRFFPLHELKPGKRRFEYLYALLLLIPGALIVSGYHLLFDRLISTSNINFETYKVFEISLFSVAGFTAMLLILTVPVFYYLKILRILRQYRQYVVLSSLTVSLLVFVFFFSDDTWTLVPLSVFYIVLALSIWLSIRANIGIFNSSVAFSIIFAIYSLYFVTILSEDRTTDNLKIRAVSMSTENDPDAEHLFLDLWPALSRDSLLRHMMLSEFFDREDVYRIREYLQDSYFNGYWSNFNFNIVLCSDSSSLQIGPDNEVVENCFMFFEERIRMNGHRLTGTDFYFIDNQGGRSYYLGRLFYKTGLNTTNGLFIELYSDINVFQPGYSELLLDKKYHSYIAIKDYSFAKYINGELVLSTGDFAYDKTDAEYIDKITDYKVFNTEGYKHVLYKNGNATIMITRSDLTFGDLIISFAYFFAYIFILSNLFILLFRRPVIKFPNLLNFRQKLQLSFIGILLFSFLLIGIVVAYITINQFHAKHYENIREKLNSVYLELDSGLSMDKQITTDLRNNNYTSLNELLIRLSNSFNTDINLYEPNGFLVATSRPEIIDRNLTSRRINNMAFINLAILGRSEYIQKERIGSLRYLSAYVPFIDHNKRVVAYLNLPYFRMQSILAKEISNVIVAIINFTLLLIVITVSMAVFISGRLTSPLRMLGEGLASVGVGKKSEQLVYNGSDEIGELVKQYNRMVDEIEDSARKLANSERESAWREMAKQIAHEIKNPLTPMKLNVQQLLKSWNDGVPGFDKLLERFTRNQIEYIDNLSSIATAFSSFAKMPGYNPDKFNLLDQIRSTLELFKNTGNVEFIVDWPSRTSIMIHADREHLNSVFANLIKNGIQAIPPNRQGRISVGIDAGDGNVVVSIRDNGTGIPDELKKKLFTPNFTTKSSGMGLGLSIAKRYVENAGGRIWFESENDSGSTFFVELPLPEKN